MSCHSLEIKKSKVRVCQRERMKTHYNPISRHRWATYTPVLMWDVVGPTGVCSSHRSLVVANEQAASWEKFYEKYPL